MVVVLLVDKGLLVDGLLGSTLEETRARPWMTKDNRKRGKISVRIMMRLESLREGQGAWG